MWLPGRAMFGACRYGGRGLATAIRISSTLIDGRDLRLARRGARQHPRPFLRKSGEPNARTCRFGRRRRYREEAQVRCSWSTMCSPPDAAEAAPARRRRCDLLRDEAYRRAGPLHGRRSLSTNAFVEEHLQDFLRKTGPTLSPFNAWVLLKGLETLPVRVERQTASAAKIADLLAERPEVERVVYPGRADHPQRDIAEKQMTAGGPLVAFGLRADKEATFRFMDALRVIKISNNLGDAKSLIAHPATTTHQRLTDEAKAELGIKPGTVRLSVGLEHPDDLISDLAQALSGTLGAGKVYTGRTSGAALARFYTIGHSNQPLDEFMRLLQEAGVNLLIDVRTIPKSRHNPQFNADPLEHALPGVGIGYKRIPELGGLRSRRKDQGPSPNGFWENENFRNYADYTATSAFHAGLLELRRLGEAQTCAIMCAEAVWWRCHRRIITDYLLAAGEAVIHIMGKGKSEPAQLTEAAIIGGNGIITYPAAQGHLLL